MNIVFLANSILLTCFVLNEIKGSFTATVGGEHVDASQIVAAFESTSGISKSNNQGIITAQSTTVRSSAKPLPTNKENGLGFAEDGQQLVIDSANDNTPVEVKKNSVPKKGVDILNTNVNNGMPTSAEKSAIAPKSADLSTKLSKNNTVTLVSGVNSSHSNKSATVSKSGTINSQSYSSGSTYSSINKPIPSYSANSGSRYPSSYTYSATNSQTASSTGASSQYEYYSSTTDASSSTKGSTFYSNSYPSSSRTVSSNSNTTTKIKAVDNLPIKTNIDNMKEISGSPIAETTAKPFVPKKPKITYSFEDDPSYPHVLPFTKFTETNNHKLSVSEPEQPYVEESREYLRESPPKINQEKYIFPLVVIIFSVPMILGIGTIIHRRVRHCWSTRHYRRMDFLVDGMYNS